MILDATCAPQNIAYPQDINLLNEAREKLEKMFDTLYHQYKTINVKRNENLEHAEKYPRKNYLEFAKLKKRSSKTRQIATKRQLNYVHHDLKLVETFLEKGMCLSDKDIARLERLSFDAYNESDVLIGSVENYKVRTGRYPSRILVDKIYGNRKNLAYCKERGIRISGPVLGRPKKDQVVDKKQEYQDAVDRIEVERRISLAKSCFGLGLIKTKLDVTTRSLIVLSILAMNVERLATFSFVKFFVSIFQAKKSQFFSFLRLNFSPKLKGILSIPWLSRL